MKRRRIVGWAVVLVACAAAAVPVARWWVERSEQRFQSHVREAPLEELQRIAAKRDWDPMVFYWLGARLSAEGRQPEAIGALARSVALNPRSGTAHAALGVALGRAGRPRQAEAQLRQAVAVDPKLPFAHFALGSLYHQYKRWQQAAETLKAANALNPGDTETQYLLALCYGELYQEDRKMEILERLVRQKPEVRFLKSLGYVYLFYGKFGQAEAIYRRILALAPDDQEAHYLLGRALAEQASTPEAFTVAERELRGVAARVKDEPGVYLALGILYFRRNEPARAVPEFERAIKLGVGEHKTWMYLGQSYMRLGRTAEGQKTLAEFERGARISREESHLENRLLNSPEASAAQRREKNSLRLRLARVYMEDHNDARALNVLTIIRESDPRNPDALKLTRECEKHLRAARPTQLEIKRPAGP